MFRRGKREKTGALRPLTAVLCVLLCAAVLLGAAAVSGMLPGRPRGGGAGEGRPHGSVSREPALPEPGGGMEKTAGAGKTAPGAGPEESPPAPDLAETLLAGMSGREKVCQLFIVFPAQITGTGRVTEADGTLLAALEEYPVGGFILDRSNLETREQVTAMLAAVQEYARIPLILTCDEEGGRVSRLMSSVGTHRIGPMLSYRGEGPEKAEENARTIALDLLSCGFNTDLAPVADVWSNEANTVIGDRAYSTDFAEAAELVAAAVRGFHEGGAACTLKHFPGHGDTLTDSHYGSAYVTKTLDELREQELLPFRAGIEAGADAVMAGHLTVSNVSDEPALFSRELLTGVLRDELGFDGVVMTDSLQMQAVAGRYRSGETAVRAIQAGADVLLCPADLDEAVEALLSAVDQGELTQERIDESVLRVLRLKEGRGILEVPADPLP